MAVPDVYCSYVIFGVGPEATGIVEGVIEVLKNRTAPVCCHPSTWGVGMIVLCKGCGRGPGDAFRTIAA